MFTLVFTPRSANLLWLTAIERKSYEADKLKAQALELAKGYKFSSWAIYDATGKIVATN